MEETRCYFIFLFDPLLHSTEVALNLSTSKTRRNVLKTNECILKKNALIRKGAQSYEGHQKMALKMVAHTFLKSDPRN